jgi:hypothetical protein
VDPRTRASTFQQSDLRARSAGESDHSVKHPLQPVLYLTYLDVAGFSRGGALLIFHWRACATADEGGIRVPFIVSWGGLGPAPRVAPDTVDNTVLGGVDWFPTVLAIAKISVPASLVLDGIDMSAAIVRLSPASNGTTIRPPTPRSKPLTWEWRFAVAGHCENSAPKLAIRDGRYKLLRDVDDGGRLELYDLSFWNASNATTPDYHENFNLAMLPGSPYQAVIDRMSSAVLAWHATLPPGPYTPSPGCGTFPFRGIADSGWRAPMATSSTEVWEDSTPTGG